MRVRPGAEEGRHSAFQAGRIQSKEGMMAEQGGKSQGQRINFHEIYKDWKIGETPT